MNPISLKEYLHKKGYRLKWVADQIGMEYVNFLINLKNGYAFHEDVAKRLETLTQGDWKAKECGRDGKCKMEIGI